MWRASAPRTWRASAPRTPTVADRARPADPWLALAACSVLVAVGVAQMGDLLTFVRMVGIHGLGAELNPIVAYAADTLGITALAVTKLALVVLVASVFLIVARRHRRVAAFVATTGTVAGLLGAFSNVLALT